ncbi:hypothetical protein BOW39_10780 [Solemya velum gill symbiont]|uniref:glycosyltransferase family 2 protein n=1 Tax=Solemya velum gill symbiont TaxID=2340 RepID=UPI000996AFBE|nr:glycosyltransferase [Solemya velum gill symbiont]OOZ48392.1 hypothetical protein BOW39_10780 [Solemya velum gill symbiont]
MKSNEKPPLVTIALPAFRQESYIGQAIDSLLNQTYSNLEILISDDASPDGTFDIIKESLQGYDGNHKVIVNRNTNNLGISHYNKIMALSSGELVVIAHGDDISMPERVATIVSAWQETGASLIASNAIHFIDPAITNQEEATKPWRMFDSDILPDNSLLSQAKNGRGKNIAGATLAWTRDVFDIFGDIDPNRSAVTTDWILPFRAALLNGVHYIDHPLLNIRQHHGQKFRRWIAFSENEDAYAESFFGNHLMQRHYMLDTLGLAAKKSLISKDVYKQASSLLVQAIILNMDKWSNIRNRLLNQNMRPVWTPIE